MFAIIQSGGKQYRVQEGDVVRVENLAGEAGSTAAAPATARASRRSRFWASKAESRKHRREDRAEREGMIQGSALWRGRRCRGGWRGTERNP
jgi:hypothetical protein